MHLYKDLSPQSRVWVYQATTPFRQEDLPEIQDRLAQFARSWVSHNQQLMAFATVHNERFVVLMVDETMAGASGCSIDKSVYFLKSLQEAYGVELFDRMYFSYLGHDGQVETVPRDEFARRYADGLITNDTMVFDTLVSTKADYEQQWIKPLGVSWHQRMVG